MLSWLQAKAGGEAMNILVIGTLDTKGSRGRLCARSGCPSEGRHRWSSTPASWASRLSAADITRQEVARAAGQELADPGRHRRQAAVPAGHDRRTGRVVGRLHAEGRVDGVVGVGGAQGTAMATAAMRALPVGLPKVMVSTVACGQTTFGPYVGTKDITMIHSVADILGLNRVTAPHPGPGSGGRRRHGLGRGGSVASSTEDRELVAITQAGITTPG